MNTEQLLSKANNVTIENAENVILDDSSTELEYNQKICVSVPPPKQQVLIDNNEIKKIITTCKVAKKSRFPLAELLLGLSSLLFGAFLSALISQIPYELCFLSIMFYTVCPAGGLTSGVAYFFCRKDEVCSVRQLAEKIEDCLSTIDEEKYNEH